MEDDIAPAAVANTNGPPPMFTVPSWQRGQKRGRGAEEDGDDDAAARGSPRRAAAAIAGAATEMEAAALWSWFAPKEVVEAVPWWSTLNDVGGAKMGSWMGSDQDPVETVATLLCPAAGPDAPALYEDGGVRGAHHPCGWDLPLPFPLHYGSEFADTVDGFAAAAGGGAKMGSDQDPVDAAAAPETMAEFMAALLSPAAGPDAPALYKADGGVRSYCGWDVSLLFPHHYDYDLATAAAPLGTASPEDDAIVDGFAATVAGDAGVPDNSSGGGGPFGFDLNQQLSSNVWDDEGFLEVPANVVVVDGSAASAADGGGGGSVELAAEDGATARRSSRGFDIDLNEPCPTETEFPDGEPDPSDVLNPAPAPAPAEDSLSAPQADEPPEVPDGGAPASPTRRRRSLTTRLWDWAFEWKKGGLKRSRR